ncbi:ZP domain-containing protein [Caenorhabditis elegans]|uniref:ZP domain-containing protein n=1 Tax=Caenorhabditis elegans TaxID=6239 RepID=Q9TZE2_CAEEL|nr:ZP domain-containing protein [Caenorhabditis elegans]CCD73389.1 ZP domain-containing protein [Caenorhabditis elegans]|eukprot:NP_490736.2 CUTiclin-Like [Caenorhabditis elegans]
MKVLVVLLLMVNSTFSFGLDNEIIGEPKLQCNPESITFSFNTRNPFIGNVYIRGFYRTPGCRRQFLAPNQAGGSFTVRLGDCGMRRSRQISGHSPRGVNQHITFVANFHPNLATKEERSFNIRCFYAHSESVVKADLDVSSMPEESFEQGVTIVPQCTYSLREGTFEGPKVSNTRVGMTIVHRWDCDTSGNYGILLRGCTILDSRGVESFPLLDENGCSVSRDFPQVVYLPSLTSAYMAIEAISFPDQPSISFSCQIKLCDKGSDECRGMSPPACTPLTQVPITGQVPMPFDNTIGNTFDGIPLEPWMKEPSPPTDDVANITSEGEPMPRLITEEEQYQIESNHVEAREKRFAHRLFNITSEDLYVEPTVEPMEVEMPGAPRETARRVSEPCVSVETFYISALAVLFVFVVSIGMVCFFGSHMLKKTQDCEMPIPVPEGYYLSKH